MIGGVFLPLPLSHLQAYPLHQFEIPSVVYMRNMYEIAQAKVCFSFHHPNWSKCLHLEYVHTQNRVLQDSDTVCVCVGVPIDNRRYICLNFKAKEATTMHGVAGYFDTTLYDNITLSKLSSYILYTVYTPYVLLLHSVSSPHTFYIQYTHPMYYYYTQ